ncbi:uncharacterized protein B0I36DRAFT_330892 [Microdochium trichocladiopsis]|uniref:Secreted protein n=1 Tax=Microdochium trichocladiopsis TaxID=1682393 RepID=A0A9P8Y3M1_9PEZI|nr:uncharacterized protein B0I36DRAFT_330892 [Microdochium trichocladiopsis]KAH7026558.1 hypothetical protein B0I36DRAFT_330892 [Microdochium trichocladiopsis]
MCFISLFSAWCSTAGGLCHRGDDVGRQPRSRARTSPIPRVGSTSLHPKGAHRRTDLLQGITSKHESMKPVMMSDCPAVGP